jgi:hypothetical protein
MAKKTTKQTKKPAKKAKKAAKEVVVQLVIPTKKKEGCRVTATESLTLVIPTKRLGCYLGYKDS